MSFSRSFQVILLVILFSQCSSDPLDIDVSDVQLDYRSRRFDASLFVGGDSNPADHYQGLYQNFDPFFSDYVERIIQLGPVDDSTTALSLRNFAQDPTVLEIQHAIDSVHTSRIAAYDKQLESAFQHYIHHFGGESPEVLYYNSGLNFAVYPVADQLGVGLDFYLGPQHNIVQNLPTDIFPQYFRNKMHPDFLAADVIKGWLLVSHQDLMDQSNLLGQIMYYGKIMYLMDACMPQVPDHIKMTYSAGEQAWAEANESAVWREIADEKVLYEIRTFEINKWVQDGPFTNAGGVPQESPAKLGIWIAWQIMRDYMEKNPEVTIPELLHESDYQKILRFYRPG